MFVFMLQISPTYQCDKTNLRYSLSINEEYKLTNSQDTSYRLYADGDVSIKIVLYLTKGNAEYSYTSDTIETPMGLGMLCNLFNMYLEKKTTNFHSVLVNKINI